MGTGVYDHWKRRIPLVTFECEVCGVQREVKPRYLELLTGRFCSKKCWGVGKRNSNFFNTACATCGSLLYRKPSELLASPRHFCSGECRSAAIKKRGSLTEAEYIKAYMRRYQDEHREINQNAREYSKRRPEVKQATAAMRLERKRAGDFTRKQWQLMKHAYNHCCCCCGRSEPDIKLTADHIVPYAKGGMHTEDNIQPLCMHCNQRKATDTTDYRPPVLIFI